MIDWDHTFVRLRSEVSGRVQYTRHGPCRGPMEALDISEHDLHFYYGGRGTIGLRDGVIPLEPEVCLWLRPGWTYRSTQDPSARINHCFLHFDLVSPAGRVLPIVHGELPPEQLSVAGAPMAAEVTRWVADAARARAVGVPGSHAKLAAAEHMLRALLMALDLTQPSRDPAKPSAAGAPHPVVASLLELIDANLHRPPSVAAMSRHAGYSTNHLIRLFRASMGVSPQQYVTRRRLAQARQLLRDPQLTVAQVAARVGYSDPLYFSRLFHKHVGQSPSEFRDGL